jgi:glycosyltransferase involved in cell wall biosynthesis
LFVGRFICEKRPLDFADAIERVARRMPVVGVMAGDGPLRPEIEARVRDRNLPIRLLGFRNQSALPALYAAAQVLVLPSQETWGLVANEAMACGLPVVVSTSAGCALDLITPDTGATCALGDVDGLAQAIAAVVAARAARPDAFRRALDTMTQTFHPERAADLTVAAIEQVAGSRAR